MRTTKLLTIAFSLILTINFAQNIEYNLRMDNPNSHYFQVEMIVSDLNQKEFEVKMPVWAPGSYLVREFAKNVDQVVATNDKNEKLSVNKVSKNAWKISSNKSKKVSIKYEVYSFELTVRTSFLDMTHGFVSGSGVFMYIDQLKNKKGRLNVTPHASFSTVTTALPKAAESESSDRAQSFDYANYDQLVDCPIEIGNQELFDFDAAGVKHHVAIYGRGNHDIPTMKKDMARIVTEATNVFGENPNKEYTFIIHNVENGQGGLEHCNSTTLSVNRWTYQGSEYTGFLSLVAHEYFHLWNVKRIRPIELGPFNYDEENYTTLLWVMEGFTSYYDELLMLRAGYYTQEEYLGKLNGSINYVEGSVGSRVQPLSHSSFDAWIKAYRPNENSANTTMTYYTRGQLMAALFDAMIVDKYDGKKSLDDFLQVIYKKYYKDLSRGFTGKEFQDELSKFIGTDMSSFFEKYIHGTEIPDYKSVFSKVGIDVNYTGTEEASFGARFSESGGKTTVRSVRRGSAAENGGLSVGDEILGFNGIRADASSLNTVFGEAGIGDQIDLLISRDNLLYELNFTITGYEQPRFKLSGLTGEREVRLRDYWLR